MNNYNDILQVFMTDKYQGPGNVQIYVPKDAKNEVRVKVTHDIHLTDENKRLLIRLSLFTGVVLATVCLIVAWKVLNLNLSLEDSFRSPREIVEER